MRNRGSILVALLWCLVLLSVLVIGVLHTARLDLRVTKHHGDSIQAYYLALAGVEKGKALLYQDAISRRRGVQNHSGQLYDSPQDFRDVALGRGQFRVMRQGQREEGGSIIYGIDDEESRLNVNNASAEVLRKLEGITPDVVAAILDYRDEDSAVTPGGAEAEHYASLQPPSLPRNGPFETVRELLLVRGVSRELFLGEDVNHNGLLDPNEDDATDSDPPDNRDGLLDAGWSSMLTVESSVRNVNAAGQDRVNVKTADESSLTAVAGITAEIARAIVASRGQNQLNNLVDLLDVAAVNQQTQAQPGRATPPQGAQPSGPKLISEDLFLEIADDLTTDDGREQAGAINVNTASAAVLACLPGITNELAQAIVAYRKSAGYLPNIAWLLKVPGMTRQILGQISPQISVRSETFRILSEGRVNSTGARKRIQVTVRVGSSSIETLAYREDP